MVLKKGGFGIAASDCLWEYLYFTNFDGEFKEHQTKKNVQGLDENIYFFHQYQRVKIDNL